MLHLLVVAFLVAGCTAEDLDADGSVPPIQVYNLDEVHHGHHMHHHGHHPEQQHGRHHEHHSHQQPYNVYLHDIKSHRGQSKVDRIVTELYNPDYYEPITVLDYRYLKSGGRDYTRDAGGQILILPKNVRINQKKEFANYDEMLEFLRLKQLAEYEAHKMEMSKLGYDQRHNDYYEQRLEVNNRQYNDYRNRHSYGGYGSAHKRGAEISSQEAQPAVQTAKENAE